MTMTEAMDSSDHDRQPSSLGRTPEQACQRDKHKNHMASQDDVYGGECNRAEQPAVGIDACTAGPEGRASAEQGGKATCPAPLAEGATEQPCALQLAGSRTALKRGSPLPRARPLPQRRTPGAVRPISTGPRTGHGCTHRRLVRTAGHSSAHRRPGAPCDHLVYGCPPASDFLACWVAGACRR